MLHKICPDLCKGFHDQTVIRKDIAGLQRFSGCFGQCIQRENLGSLCSTQFIPIQSIASKSGGIDDFDRIANLPAKQRALMNTGSFKALRKSICRQKRACCIMYGSIFHTRQSLRFLQGMKNGFRTASTAGDNMNLHVGQILGCHLPEFLFPPGCNRKNDSARSKERGNCPETMEEYRNAIQKCHKFISAEACGRACSRHNKNRIRNHKITGLSSIVQA
jgi:hypothetical protein